LNLLSSFGAPHAYLSYNHISFNIYSSYMVLLVWVVGFENTSN
jgi:hypothetical protein